MYKLTQLDGYDFYSHTINYADAVGSIVRVTDYDNADAGVCGRGLHASRNPNDCFVGARLPCRAFRVEGIGRITGDKTKTRYKALKVIEEVRDLNRLFGWNYSEVINPINPFEIIPPKITKNELDLLKEWASVRDSVRDSVWYSVWDSVRASVRDSVWYSVWDSVWDSVRDYVWDSVLASVRDSVWDSLRGSLRDYVRDYVWESMGAYIGSLFPNIKQWKYVKHRKGVYPFQPAVDLWRMGLVPSHDGTVWRLHGGNGAEIVWEGNI